MQLKVDSEGRMDGRFNSNVYLRWSILQVVLDTDVLRDSMAEQNVIF